MVIDTIQVNYDQLDEFNKHFGQQTEETAYSPYLRQSGNLEFQAYLNTSLGNTLLKQGAVKTRYVRWQKAGHHDH
jgi:hypothetical protein